MAAADRRRGGAAPPVGATASSATSGTSWPPCPTGWTVSTSSSTRANGAASVASPEAFRRAGARVSVIGASPDGLNINDGYGSTHLERLCEAVLAEGADFGVAHDGDADRCLAVDGSGYAGRRRPDHVDPRDLACATRAVSSSDTLVATVMSNLGMLQAMERSAITVRQTAVGDRYVLEDMKAGGYALGGEQSGHVILLEHGTTGDGVLTGLMLAARVAETGRSLTELGVGDDPPPAGPRQRARRRHVTQVDSHEALLEDVAKASDELDGSGRVLLRKSGTEPLVRVMVEAADESQAQAVAQRLADSVRMHLALR